MNELRKGLPPLPARIKALPISNKGYPVPYFVSKVNGEWDFRIMDPAKFVTCLNNKRCWICGGPLGTYKAFNVGPVSTISRTSGEPPSHLECAEFAVKACPFLLLPKAQRRDAGLPKEMANMGGHSLPHNPGVACVWVTSRFNVVRDHGGDGVLIRMGDPTSVAYYVQGRPATREEVEEGMSLGLPAVYAASKQDTPEEQAKVHRSIEVARSYWPKE